MIEPIRVTVKEDFDLYAGRAAPRAKDPRCRRESVYANPYRIGVHGNREQVISLYEALWRRRLETDIRELWLGFLRALTGKRVACWCEPPLPCHVDVLIELWREFCGAPEADTQLSGQLQGRLDLRRQDGSA